MPRPAMSVGVCGRKSCASQAFRGHLLRALCLETLGATSVLVRSGTYAPGTPAPSARLRRVLGIAAPAWLRFLLDGRAGRCAAAGLFFAPQNLANITGRGTRPSMRPAAAPYARRPEFGEPSSPRGRGTLPCTNRTLPRPPPASPMRQCRLLRSRPPVRDR